MRHWRDLSVGRKVVAPFVALTLMLGVLVSAVASQQLASTRAQQLSVLAVRAEGTADTVSNAAEERQLAVLRLLSATPGIDSAIARHDAAGLTQLILPVLSGQLPENLEARAISSDGLTILRLGVEPGGQGCLCDTAVSRFDYAHLDDVLHLRADAYGDRYAGVLPDAGGWLVYTIGPIVDSHGAVAGALIVGQQLDAILASLGPRSQVALTLFSAGGLALASSGSLGYVLPDLRPAARAAAMQGQMTEPVPVEAGGRRAVVFFAPWELRSRPAGYEAVVVPADAGPSEPPLLLLVLLICGGCLGLTLIVGSAIGRSVTEPLKGLLRATEEVAGGNLGYRAPVASKDEIGRLTWSFNGMTAVLAERTGRLERLSNGTLVALASALDARDHYTHGHAQRVAAYSCFLAERAALPVGEIEAIRLGCLLHDVGKIGIPDSVLHKTSRLDPLEMAHVRQHPVIGYRMLRGLEWPQAVLDVVLHHHERWDGTGYPLGLAANSIPRAARVVAIGDALDAMTSSRPYRPALSYDVAAAEIFGGASAEFDPALVAIFAAIRNEFGELVAKLLGSTELAPEPSRLWVAS